MLKLISTASVRFQKPNAIGSSVFNHKQWMKVKSKRWSATSLLTAAIPFIQSFNWTCNHDSVEFLWWIDDIKYIELTCLVNSSNNAGRKRPNYERTRTPIRCAVILSLKEHHSAAVTSFRSWPESAASLWTLLLLNALVAAHIVNIKIGIVPNFIVPGTFVQFNIEISSLNLITHCTLVRLHFWTLCFYQ